MNHKMVPVEGNFEREYIEQLIKNMYVEDGYKSTWNSALQTAAVSAPVLTKISVAVNACLGGSLGTRSTRKQLQALFHGRWS